MPPNASPDVSATLSADGKTLTLFAVNSGTTEVARTFDFSAFDASSDEIARWTLADRDAAGQPDVANSFADPTRVRVAKGTLALPENRRLTVHFAPFTLTVIQVRLRA